MQPRCIQVNVCKNLYFSASSNPFALQRAKVGLVPVFADVESYFHLVLALSSWASVTAEDEINKLSRNETFKVLLAESHGSVFRG